jgi:predicted transcriptional regulator
MTGYSMNQAAKQLGISNASLSRYVAAGKVPAPKGIIVADVEIRSWTEADIERVRKVLPKIANGRKHRKKAKKPDKNK